VGALVAGGGGGGEGFLGASALCDCVLRTTSRWKASGVRARTATRVSGYTSVYTNKRSGEGHGTAQTDLVCLLLDDVAEILYALLEILSVLSAFLSAPFGHHSSLTLPLARQNLFGAKTKVEAVRRQCTDARARSPTIVLADGR